MTFTPPSIEELQELFPSYLVEGFIAQGGMGAVYLGRQISLDRPVAIKILPDVFCSDEDYRISFATEARAMAKLNHKNLVGIYDFGEVDGMLYIVMEFVPGRTLYDTATGKTVDEKEAARLISAISLGLDYAHNAGMIHRDIKPANVLIDDDVRPKIVDFGLARPTDEQQTEGVVLGTPGYTAPEIIKDTHPVDHRSDIFSIGVMLYELLTGRIPDNPIIPASKLSKTDPRFDIIINKSIHSDPNQRYESAKELSDALQTLLQNFDNKGVGILNTAPSEKFTTTAQLTASSAVSPLTKRTSSLNLRNSGLQPTVTTSSRVGINARPSLHKKKSNAGILVLLIIVIGGVIGAVWYKQLRADSSNHSKGSVVDEVINKKSHNTEASAPLGSNRANLVNETREERESRLLQAKLEKIEKRRARREEKTEERTALRPKFNIEKFLKKELAKSNKKIKLLSKKADDLMEPEYDRMGVELKTQIGLFLKGDKGVQAKKMVDDYLRTVKKHNSITPLPAELPTGIEGGLNVILKKYHKKRALVMKNLVAEMETVRASYAKRLRDEKANLASSDDFVGASKLDGPISAAQELPSFLVLFSSAK